MELTSQCLPNPLPTNPLQVAADWLQQAWADAAQPNPNAMVLATVDRAGRPSARVVLCKEIAAEPGYIVFYTNYESRKGKELAANPHAALTFHWDHRDRQVRFEGAVQRLSGAESDRYFGSRPWPSRLGAWASRQSQPIGSRQALLDQVADAALKLGAPTDPAAGLDIAVNIPRPAHWGGFKFYADAVELWVAGDFRIHDRARWERAIDMRSTPPQHGPWRATRLQP
jgi:pyridoxamine 5'-phosphate oxidase